MTTKSSPDERLLTSRNADEIAQAILDGADPNARNSRGETLLHEASHRRDFRLAKALIALGADVNARDASGATPLHHALPGRCTDAIVAAAMTHFFNGPALGQPHIDRLLNDEIARLLLQHGADVNAVDHEGRAPLHYSIAPKTTQLLIDHGADPLIDDNTGLDARAYSVTGLLGRSLAVLHIDVDRHCAILSAEISKAQLQRELSSCGFEATPDDHQEGAYKRTRRM